MRYLLRHGIQCSSDGLEARQYVFGISFRAPVSRSFSSVVTDEFSQKAAENKRPPTGVGNTEQVDDVDEKTRHSDGRQLPRRQPEPAPAKPFEKKRPL